LGQKVHPVGFRLGVTKDWQAKWYADKHYTEFLQEDLKIRKLIESRSKEADISRVEIERASNQVTVTVYTARPGIVIGRGGQRVDEMRLLLERLTGKRIRLNIEEVRQPELDAFLVARNISHQVERRVSYRRAMKQAISRAMESGAKGIKVNLSGRLGGSEYARKETLHQGRVPLHTLRADIDYAQGEAHTTLGRVGVKVWIYKGDIIPESKMLPAEAPLPGAREEASVEVPEGDIREEVSVEVPEGAAHQEASVEVPEGDVHEEASAEVPEGAAHQEASAEVPEGAAREEASVEVPEGAAHQEASAEVPEGAAREEASVEVPEGDIREEVSVEVPEGAAHQEAGVEVPEEDVHEEAGAEVNEEQLLE